jgi:hypothetical protein
MPQENKTKPPRKTRSQKLKTASEGAITPQEVIERAYDAFVYWLSIPELDRQPRTLDEFCTMYAVTKPTLKEFMQRAGFYDLLEQRSVQWAQSKIPAILHSMYARIKQDQSIPDIRQFLEYVREYNRKPDNKTTNVLIINPSDDQYRQIISREAAILGDGSA